MEPVYQTSFALSLSPISFLLVEFEDTFLPLHLHPHLLDMIGIKLKNGRGRACGGAVLQDSNGNLIDFSSFNLPETKMKTHKAERHAFLMALDWTDELEANNNEEEEKTINDNEEEKRVSSDSDDEGEEESSEGKEESSDCDDEEESDDEESSDEKEEVSSESDEEEDSDKEEEEKEDSDEEEDND
ncbi:hypothetical protein V6N13_096799 [Hibiscus sabdariffa]